MTDENTTPQDAAFSENGDTISSIVRASEYLLMPRPNLEFVWENRVPRPGVTLFSGEPKLGKSHLALQIALAVATGAPLAGQPTKECRVLYLMLEAELSWKKLLEKAGPLPPNLIIPHPDYPHKPPYTNVMEARSVDWMLQMVKEADPTLVILDPLRDAHSQDEQSSTEMKKMTDMLKMVFNGLAQIWVHHTNKMSDEFDTPSPIRSARGSSGLTGTVDTIWTFYGKDRGIKTLSMLPKWEDEEYHALERKGDGFWRFTGEKLDPATLAKVKGASTGVPQ